MIRIALIAQTGAVVAAAALMAAVMAAGPAAAQDDRPRDRLRPGMTAAEVEAVLGKPTARARFSNRLLIRWERPAGKNKTPPRTYVFDEDERLVGPLRPEEPAQPSRPPRP